MSSILILDQGEIGSKSGWIFRNFISGKGQCGVKSGLQLFTCFAPIFRATCSPCSLLTGCNPCLFSNIFVFILFLWSYFVPTRTTGVFGQYSESSFTHFVWTRLKLYGSMIEKQIMKTSASGYVRRRSTEKCSWINIVKKFRQIIFRNRRKFLNFWIFSKNLELEGQVWGYQGWSSFSWA